MEIYFKFSEQKKLLAFERHEYTLWEYTWLQAWGCTEQGFNDVITMTQYCWIIHNRVSRELQLVESGSIVQIKQKINILTDFEISYLKSQSLRIDYLYFILQVLHALPNYATRSQGRFSLLKKMRVQYLIKRTSQPEFLSCAWSISSKYAKNKLKDFHSVYRN